MPRNRYLRAAPILAGCLAITLAVVVAFRPVPEAPRRATPPELTLPPVAGAAIGQANPNPTRVRGGLWVYGEAEGIRSGADVTVKLRSAVAKASTLAQNFKGANGGSTPTATVFLPAGAYSVSDTVNIPSNVELRGERGGTLIQGADHFGGSPLAIGMGMTGLPSQYRPDLFGVLDSTAASGSGQRRGFRTNTDGKIRSMGSAFSHGGFSPSFGFNFADGWCETQKLTIDFAVKPGAGNVVFPGGVSVFGAESNAGGPAFPVSVRTDGANAWCALVCYQATRFGPPLTALMNFSSGSAVGLQRITVQIDTLAGTGRAWANGFQVATTFQLSTTSDLAPNTFFNETTFAPWTCNMGAAGSAADFTLAGICYSRGLRYADNGAGTAQARADTGTISDRYRYFPASGDDANCITYLRFDESDPTSTHLRCAAGPKASSGAESSAFIFTTATDISAIDSRVTNLAVKGFGGYGYGIMMANCLATKITGCISEGPIYGVGNLPYGANYLITVKDCTLAGNDNGYFAYNSILKLRDINFRYNGKACVRTFGCNSDMRDLFISDSSPNQVAAIMIHSGEYGSVTTIQDSVWDNEGTGYPLAGIYAERPVAGGALRLGNINLAGIGSAPMLMLRVMNPANPGVAILDAKSIFAGGSGPTVDVDGDGSKWRGSVSLTPPNASPAVVGSGASGITAVSYPP